jgi:hypothetical protein
VRAENTFTAGLFARVQIASERHCCEDGKRWGALLLIESRPLPGCPDVSTDNGKGLNLLGVYVQVRIVPDQLLHIR